MATTAPTPLFTGGNVAQYTKETNQTDDTNLFSLGNIFSILEYGIATDDINTVQLKAVVLDLVELVQVELKKVLNIVV